MKAPNTPPRGDDAAFLARLERSITGVEARRRRRFRVGAAALLLTAGALAGLQPWRGEEAPRTETVCEMEKPELREDPVATLLLEAARLRLDGFGDPSRARARLVEVMDQYPDTTAAAEARRLIQGLGENT